LDKYANFIVPEAEADWHGLTMEQALDKLVALERLQEEQSKMPLKQEFRQELIDLLRAGYLEDVSPDVLYEDQNKDTTVSQAYKGLKKRVNKTFKSK